MRRLRRCGIALIALASHASAQTQTLDDRDSSIQYETGGPGWNAGPGCGNCFLQPDPSQAFDGTWHDNTWAPGDSALSVTIPFTGTGITIYNIIPDNEPNADTNLQFTMDGSSAGSFTYSPSGNSAFLYKHNVFSQSGLSNGAHTLVMSVDSGSGMEAILFDYAEYTVEVAVPTTSPAQSPSTQASQPTTSPEQQQSSSPQQQSSPTSSPANSPSSPSSSAFPSNPGSSSPGSQNASPSSTGTGTSTGTGSSASASSANSLPSGTSKANASDGGSTSAGGSPTGAASGSSTSSTDGVQPADDNSGSTSSNSSSSSSFGAMIAGILIGIAAITLGIFLLLLRRRRRRTRLPAEMVGADTRPVSGLHDMEQGRLVGAGLGSEAASRSDFQAPSSVALTEGGEYRDAESDGALVRPSYAWNMPGARDSMGSQPGGTGSTSNTDVASTYESPFSSHMSPSEERAAQAAAISAKRQAEEDRERERQRDLANPSTTARWSATPTHGTVNPHPSYPLPAPPLPPFSQSARSSSAPAPEVVEQIREQMGTLLAEVHHLRAQQAEQEAELRVLRTAEPLPQYEPNDDDDAY